VTDLVRYEPKTSIDLAPEAWNLAQKVSQTEFVPAALRGRPEAVLAAMLTGHEVGIGPMQALSKIHVIEGRPSMAAELMRALVMREGHELWIEESSGTRCTVGAKRSNSTRETRVTWSMDDAKRAGLDGRQNWRKYPRAMLLARATAEICRAVFPDLLAGISYTSEELTDGDVIDSIEATVEPPAAAPARTARARKAATRTAPAAAKATAPAAAAPGPVPPLPGEDDYEGPDEHLDPRTYSGPQLLAIKLGEFRVKDRATRLAVIGRMLGRPIESSKDLTTEEVSWLAQAIAADDFDVEAVLQSGEPAPERTRAGDGEEEGEASGPVETEPEGGPGPCPPSGGSPPIDANSTPVPPPPPPPPPVANPSDVVDPDSWTEGAWRTFLADRGVKVTELLREAHRLAKEDGVRGPGTLEDLAGPATSHAVKSLLVGFVEETAVARGAPS
jgi:hypothetical protein